MARVDATHALHILQEEHQHLRALFQDFREAADESLRRKILDVCGAELRAQIAVEDSVLYARLTLPSDDETLAALRADHAWTLAEIADVEEAAHAGQAYQEKFLGLTRRWLEHQARQETALYPRLAGSGDELKRLGLDMLERKREVLAEDPTPAADTTSSHDQAEG